MNLNIALESVTFLMKVLSLNTVSRYLESSVIRFRDRYEFFPDVNVRVVRLKELPSNYLSNDNPYYIVTVDIMTLILLYEVNGMENSTF